MTARPWWLGLAIALGALPAEAAPPREDSVHPAIATVAVRRCPGDQDALRLCVQSSQPDGGEQWQPLVLAGFSQYDEIADNRFGAEDLAFWFGTMHRLAPDGPTPPPATLNLARIWTDLYWNPRGEDNPQNPLFGSVTTQAGVRVDLTRLSEEFRYRVSSLGSPSAGTRPLGLLSGAAMHGTIIELTLFTEQRLRPAEWAQNPWRPVNNAQEALFDRAPLPLARPRLLEDEGGHSAIFMERAFCSNTLGAGEYADALGCRPQSTENRCPKGTAYPTYCFQDTADDETCLDVNHAPDQPCPQRVRLTALGQLQRDYVKRVVDATIAYPYVVYEIMNEPNLDNPAAAVLWHRAVAAWIRERTEEYERNDGRPTGTYRRLVVANLNWACPAPRRPPRAPPPARRLPSWTCTARTRPPSSALTSFPFTLAGMSPGGRGTGSRTRPSGGW